MKRLLNAFALTIGLLVALTNASAQRLQQVFETPQQAMEAFGQAVQAKDSAALVAILGADYQDVIPPVSKDDYQKFVAAWTKQHSLKMDSADRAHIEVGGDGWLLPIPMEKIRAGWFFDMDAAEEEVRIFNIGANELAVIKTMMAYYDAQNEYAEKDRLGDGVLQYAQKVRSTPGRMDGLYWPTNAGEPQSPLGELFAQAAARSGIDREGFHGYHYRILTAQGKNAQGGAQSYVVNGRMIGGFGLVAWPVDYDETGVMSFIVNHQGVVYEKNLGPDTARVVKQITTFNPDASWQQVK